MGVLKKIVDIIYGTQRVCTKYSRNFPNELIVASDASKGIKTSKEKEIKRGIEWVTSQRAILILTNERLKCGKWDIELDDIENASLIKINTIFGLGQVLKITTKSKENYQFGMQMNEEWLKQTVLPLNLENGELKLSKFSIFLRIALLIMVIYWMLEKLT